MKAHFSIRLVVAIVALFVPWAASTASAQCPPLNCNDTVSDYTALQCRLNQGGTITLAADGCQYGYYIDQTLNLSVSGTTLTSTSAYGYRALLVAMPSLSTPMLKASSGVSNYTISKIWFWGNKYNRTNPDCTEGSHQSVNLYLRGSGWLINNIESDYVPCQTSTVVIASSSNFEIRNSWFANNGFDMGSSCTSTRCWADGLTVHGCSNGYIHNNTFQDNTDVDLIVGGGNCRIQNNTIQHYNTYGFAGFMVTYFSTGNHSGATYSSNNVTSARNKLGFGIMVGTHPWDSDFNLGNAGNVTSNGASGAVLNLTVEGISGGGQVTANTVSGAQGTRGFAGCTVSRNYTVYHPHAGSASLQSGSFELQFDNNVCTPR